MSVGCELSRRLDTLQRRERCCAYIYMVGKQLLKGTQSPAVDNVAAGNDSTFRGHHRYD